MTKSTAAMLDTIDSFVILALAAFFAVGLFTGCSLDTDTPTPTTNIVEVTPSPSASVPTDTGAPQGDATPVTDSGSNETAVEDSGSSDADAADASGDDSAPVDAGSDADSATAIDPTLSVFDYDVEAHQSQNVAGGKSVLTSFVGYMLCAGDAEDVIVTASTVASVQTDGVMTDNACFVSVATRSYGNVLGQSALPSGTTGQTDQSFISPVRIPMGACIPFDLAAMVAAPVSWLAAPSKTGVCHSGYAPALSLVGLTAVGASTGKTAVVSMDNAHASKPMIVRKTTITVLSRPLPTTVFADGQQDLFSFQVCADVAGSAGLKEFQFGIMKSDTVAVGNFSLRRGSYSLSSTEVGFLAGGTWPATDWIVAGRATDTLEMGFVGEEYVTTCNAYTLNGLVKGVQVGSSLVVELLPVLTSDVTHLPLERIQTGQLFRNQPYRASITDATGTFDPAQALLIWSDMSEPTHSVGTADWAVPYGTPDFTNGLYVTTSLSASVFTN